MAEKLPDGLMEYLKKYGYLERHGDVLKVEEKGKFVVVIFEDSWQSVFVNEDGGWEHWVFDNGGYAKSVEWTKVPRLSEDSKTMLKFIEENGPVYRDIAIAYAVLEHGINIDTAKKHFRILENLGLVDVADVVNRRYRYVVTEKYMKFKNEIFKEVD